MPFRRREFSADLLYPLFEPGACPPGCAPASRMDAKLETMSGRPSRFEHFRFLGDKRTQVVYDVDHAATPKATIDELVESGQGATFGPDSLAEARNRNYKPFKVKR